MLMHDFGDGRGFVPARRHTNGGGMVALTATVEPTVFLGPGCAVFGHACLLGKVHVSGGARISGLRYPPDISTRLEDQVRISGNVVIEGCVLMRDNAQARGNARLTGAVQMHHRSIAADRALMEGDVILLDSVYLGGDVAVLGRTEQIVIQGEELITGQRLIQSPRDLGIEDARNRRRIALRLMRPHLIQQAHAVAA